LWLLQSQWQLRQNFLRKPDFNRNASKAQYAFADSRRVIAEDLAHSGTEKRYFCFGEVEGGILTVRFTYRGGVIRIFGAGYWRKGRTIYDHENQIHR
jgi:uncharacterized protein